MPFLGHLKSLHLISRYNSGTRPASQAQGEGGSDATEDGEISIPTQGPTSEFGTESRPSFQTDVIIDERGHGPSKSLWIGNIPPRTTSTQLRTLFARFGTILSTKLMAKYAFVNFERLESAIAAFRQYHDRDIFDTGCSTINVRFTGSQAESRKAKDDIQERRCSVTMKAQAAQRQYFQPIDAARSSVSASSPTCEWPNGAPPTGPKSQRKDISPPPLRRGDTYRPGSSGHADNLGSIFDHRWSNRERNDRGRSYLRRSDCHYSPAYSSSGSRSTCRSQSRSGYENATPIQNRGDESPSLFQRQKHTQRQGCLVQNPEVAVSDDTHSCMGSCACASRAKHCLKITTPSLEGQETGVEYCERFPTITAPGHVTETQAHSGTEPDEQFGIACNLSSKPKGVAASKTLITQQEQRSKSPSAWPLERLRIENESIRASSVPSDVATSSSRASVRKKRCYDCKKPASELSPFTSCSKCTRRFHSGCGDPKPSSWCGRCQRNLQKSSSAAHVDNNKITRTIPSTKLSRNIEPDSSPFSWNHGNTETIIIPPCENIPQPCLDEQKLRSLFEARSVTLGARRDVESRESSRSRNTDTENIPPANTRVAHQNFELQTPISALTNDENPLRKKYKEVTCKWWASGNCTQTESGCYYAHRYTGVTFPDQKRMNKSWTCYDWLSDTCSLSEGECLHAHKDTGLHIWKDGRPSFKHVTCFWWSKGRCKWDAEFCKFAHKDMGLYSLDPSEIWQGGSKFSTTHPHEGRVRTALDHRSDASVHSSKVDQSKQANVSPNPRLVQSDIVTDQRSTATTTSVKPLLTIDTCTNSSLLEAHRLILGVKPRPIIFGAPPQTPNEDSPDKQLSRGFNDSSNRTAFLERISDLPTPDTDETVEPEYDPGDYLELQYNHGDDKSADYLDCRRLSVASTERISFLHSKNVSDTTCSLFSGGVIDKHEFIQMAETKKNGVSQDPRLHRSDRIGGYSPTFSPCKSSHELAKHQAFGAASIGDDAARPGVKKCQICYKQVFGTDICRICSNSKDVLHDSSLPNPFNQPSGTASEVPEEDLELMILPSLPVEKLKLSSKEPASQPASKNVLKRHNNNDNLFLKNKRPRILQHNNSSGGARRHAYRTLSLEKRPVLDDLKSTSRREPKQTLDDLITQERAKNKKQNLLHAGRTAVQPPTNAVDEESKPLESDGDQLLTEGRISSRLEPVTTSVDDRVSVSADSFSSSPSPPPQVCTIHDCVRSNSDSDRYMQCGESNEEGNDSNERPSHEVHQWRLTDSPEIRRSKFKTSQSCERIPSPIPQSPSKRSPQRIKTSQQAESAQSETPNSAPARGYYCGMATSPKKFSWASAITCTRCQKSHKKCLHNDDGTLSATKCREYVLSRKGKPDTGRSRDEWSTILRASELEIDSDEDFIVDETSESESIAPSIRQSCSGDSEDDSPTMVDTGDTMLERDDDFYHPASPESHPKPVLRVVLPILKTSLETEITEIVAEKADTVSPVDEVEPARRRLQGEMLFESESDDETYHSDECASPARQERPVDPLRAPPKWSRDLFEIAPELMHTKALQGTENLRVVRPRPSRKQQWAELRGRQLQERREKFGNPHWEVDRMHADVMVTAVIERIVPPRNTDDRFAVGSVQIREEEIGFCDFLGAPKLPEICLMNDGERLGFQDGQKERDRTFGRTGRGLGKPTTDDEKWPVRTNEMR